MSAMIKIAAKDLRGGLQSFAVFVTALLLGVAAVAAVGTISTAVDQSIARDARALNGGDIVLRQRNASIDRHLLDQVLPERTAFAEVIRTNTYVKAPNGRRLVVSLKGVGTDYPIYGALRTEPTIPASAAFVDQGALAEPALMTRLGVEVGDMLEIGTITVELRGAITHEPDRVGGFINIGPRLMVSIATMRAAGILAEGALARHEYQFGLPAGSDAKEAAEGVRLQHPNARFRTITFDEVQPRVQRLTGRLETYLTLAAVAALLTGGFAVGLAIQAYLAGKERTIAAMRSQGATSAQILQIYGLQVAIIVAVGAALGLVLGFAIPWAGTAALDQLVPSDLVIRPAMQALLPAALLGALTAAIFAVLPLARASDMPAAHLFRAYLGAGTAHLRKRWYGLLAIVVAAMAASVSLAVPQGWVALAVLASIALIGGLLALMGRLILTGLRRARRLLPVDFRAAAGSLTGPGNNSLSVIIGLGFGLAALIAIALIEANLVREIFSKLPDRAPSMVLIDIQKQQTQPLEAALAAQDGVEILQSAPIVRGRVVRIKNVAVEELDLPEEVRWTINSDRGLSYRAEPEAGTVLVAGSWWNEDDRDKVLVSIEQEIAAGYGVGVGDQISFNFAGRAIDATIANIREEIDWGEGRINFVFILNPGLIEQAPQTTAMSLELPREAEAPVLDRLAEDFPNVTPINIRDIVDQVNAITQKLGYAIRGIAAVTVVSGILVVAAAVQVSYRNRLRDIGIMRAIGASKKQARAMVLAEHGLMAAAASLPALMIGGIGAWAAVRFVLDIEWYFEPIGVALVLALALMISLITGLFMVTKLLNRTTASILRQS